MRFWKILRTPFFRLYTSITEDEKKEENRSISPKERSDSTSVPFWKVARFGELNLRTSIASSKKRLCGESTVNHVSMTTMFRTSHSRRLSSWKHDFTAFYGRKNFDLVHFWVLGRDRSFNSLEDLNTSSVVNFLQMSKSRCTVSCAEIGQ